MLAIGIIQGHRHLKKIYRMYVIFGEGLLGGRLECRGLSHQEV